MRSRNVQWLREWEATLPPEAESEGEFLPTFTQMLRRMRAEGKAGRALPWVIDVDGALAGQVTVGGITYGSLRSAYIGYWIDQRVANRGVMSTAVALATDFCFQDLLLHRIELNIRPENEPSLAVARKLGFRLEGERLAYLHINGDWRDHLTFVLLAGDQPTGVLNRLQSSTSARSDTPNS